MNYKTEITKAMNMLAQHPKTMFIGQTVKYPGSVISDTLKDIPDDKKIEMPVAEDMQLGLCTGMSLHGFIPIAIYPRIDFLLCAVNQLSNHLDVLKELTNNQYKAKVIIRTIIGSKVPFDGGIQHTRDLTEAFTILLNNIPVIKLTNAGMVMPSYEFALESDKSVLMIEMAELYNG